MHTKKNYCFFLMIWICANAAAQPISLLPENPHYFFYSGKPTILITSAEHYGAVVNKAFEYNAYFDWLHSYGLNYTRIYPGAYTELPDKWAKENTLGIESKDVIVPWARSNESGYALGGNKFDLDRWDEEYFKRLHDFIEKAAAKGIIVEVCLFNAQYKDAWPICPLFHANNIQQIGTCSFVDVQTLSDTALVAKHTAYVQKIVREVNAYDNIILELCDEPIINGTAIEEGGKWLNYLIDIIVKTEKQLPKKHLIAQQIEGPFNGPCDFSKDKRIDIVVCQYVWEAYGAQIGSMQALDSIYDLNKPIELNETYYFPSWYAGDSVAASRVEAWEYFIGGGTSFNQLNARYTVSNPAGNTPDNAKVCASLKVLKTFLYGFDFVKMRRDDKFIAAGIPDGSFCRGISWPGNQYALYIHHSRYANHGKDSAAYQVIPGSYKHDIVLNIPKGKYKAEWINPVSGTVISSALIDSKSDTCKFTTPVYSIDIALRLKKVK